MRIPIILLSLFLVSFVVSKRHRHFIKDDPPCRVDEDYKLCIIDADATYQNSVFIDDQATQGYPLLITGAKLNCTSTGKIESISNCELHVQLKAINASILIQDSHLAFSNITLSSDEGNITIDQTSVVDATALGYTNGQGAASKNTGACYGGQGGGCHPPCLDKTYGNFDINYDVDDQSMLIGSGGSGTDGKTTDGTTRGGGRIVLRGKQLALAGSIYANGGPQNGTLENNFNGGSGGYIYLEALNLTLPSTISGPITTLGGVGTGTGYAGSGGRIVYKINETDTSVLQQLDASGGVVKNQSPCYNGGAGTIYSVLQDKLTISGPNLQSTTDIQKTPLKGLSRQKNLTSLNIINNGAAVPDYDIESNGNNATFYVRHIIVNGGVITTPIGNGSVILDSLTIECETISITGEVTTRKRVVAAANLIILANDSIFVNSSSKIEGLQTNTIQLKSNGTIEIQGQIVTVAGDEGSNSYFPGLRSKYLYTSIPQATLLYISAKSKLSVLSSAQITGFYYLTIFSENDIEFGPNLDPVVDQDGNKHTTCRTVQEWDFVFALDYMTLPLSKEDLFESISEQLNITDNSTLDVLVDPLLYNYTFVALALGNLKIDNSGLIQSSRVALYGGSIDIQGHISTDGLGCPQNMGSGRGWNISEPCPSTGGSYGGSGGAPIKDNIPCANAISQPYGRHNSFYLLDGSGGGTPQAQTKSTNGRGGGMIFVQTDSLTHTGELSSNGGSAAQPLDGGGSGGSIYLAINKLIGKPGGKFSSRGGSTIQGSTMAGGGSGGRIKFYYYNWFNLTKYDTMTMGFEGNQTKLVDASGGNSLAINQFDDEKIQVFLGEDGSVWSTPCQKGFYSVFCQQCPKGKYKNEVSSFDCYPCENIIDPNKANYTSEGWMNPLCPYQCIEATTDVSSNPLCYNTFMLFVNNLGGLQIFIIIIVATVFAVIAILFFLWQYQKHKDEDENYNLLQAKKLMSNLDFIDRDIQQHVGRVYLIGSNSLEQPWKIPQNPPISLLHRINKEKYSLFASKMSQGAQWTKMQKTTLRLVQIFYPALAPRFQRAIRKRIYKRYKNLFINDVDSFDFFKENEGQTYINIKFTCSSDFTLAFIDFIDTKKDKGLYNGPSLPLTLLISGSGLFSTPFNIQIRDPLVKSVAYLLEEKQMWEYFISNLNSQMAPIHLKGFTYVLARDIMKALDFINYFNDNYFEHNGGFRIQVWLFRLVSQDPSQKGRQQKPQEDYYILDQEYFKKHPEVLKNLIKYIKLESSFNSLIEFKLGIVLREASTMTERKSNANTDILPAGKVGSNTTSNSLELNNSAIRFNGKYRKSSGLESNNLSQQDDTVNVSQQMKNIHTVSSHIREVYTNNGHTKSEFKRRKLGCKNNCLLFMLNFYSLFHTIYCKNKREVTGIKTYMVLFLVLMVIDTLLTSQITIHLFSPQIADHSEIILWLYGWPFLFLYPGTMFLADISGFLCLVNWKPWLWQIFIYLNALSSLTNLLITFILFCVYESQKVFFIIVLVILIIVKITISNLASLHISYFSNPKYDFYQHTLEKVVKDVRVTTMHLVMNEDGNQSFEDQS